MLEIFKTSYNKRNSSGFLGQQTLFAYSSRRSFYSTCLAFACQLVIHHLQILHGRSTFTSPLATPGGAVDAPVLCATSAALHLVFYSNLHWRPTAAAAAAKTHHYCFIASLARL
ncbi:hypothetical protein NL676_021622 [Syzygium grande]|nr:hypothetical protein NL676_021622 [Syzygium grande]